MTALELLDLIREYSIDYPETCNDLRAQVERFKDGDSSKEDAEAIVLSEYDALELNGEVEQDSEDWQGIRDIQNYIIDFSEEN